MSSIPRLRLTAGSSAEEVECLDELITNILSRVSTRDVLKMSTVRKRWRTLISNPGFVHTHYRNCPNESIICFTDIEERQTPEQYQFRSYNFQTGLTLVDENPYTPYTLVFDSQLNSWYSGQPLPLLRYIDIDEYDSVATQLFYNGVIYFVVRVESREAEEMEEFRDAENLYRDDRNLLHMIIGYDVKQDQWGFHLLVPASVGFIFRLTEWEGNLLVCASTSWNSWDGGDGHFVFWILDTEHKLWIREQELDLSHELHFYWKVFASGGVVWFTCGEDSVIVYHMKNRHWSRHRLDDAYDIILYVTFEPTLLSF